MTTKRAAEIIDKIAKIPFDQMEMEDQIIFMNAVFEAAVKLEPVVERYSEPAVGKKITFLAQIV